MQEFYYKDKNKNFAIRGIVPHNDFNCLPFDYFRLGHAMNVSNVYEDLLKVKCPIHIPQKMIRRFCLENVDEMIKGMLESSTPMGYLLDVYHEEKYPDKCLIKMEYHGKN